MISYDCVSVCVCTHLLLEYILGVHSAVEFGKFDGHDDTGDKEQTAATQTEPECVLQCVHTHIHFTPKTLQILPQTLHIKHCTY